MKMAMTIKMGNPLLFLVLNLLVLARGQLEISPEGMDLDTGGLSRESFPKDFIYGTATSAYQVEGAAHEDGRGDSIWDVFVKQPGLVTNNASGEVAVDQYHRYKEDVDLMTKLNFDAYRFSISWSRIFPTGTGKVNWKGVAYYNRLINYMLKKGITPYANLNHYDLPQALQEKYNGWLSRKVVKDYADFADFCFKMYGDRVKNWFTFNEPRVVASLGYDNGYFAPSRCSRPYGNCKAGNSGTEPYTVAHNLILCHASAVQRYREKYQKTHKGRTGILLDFTWYEPLTRGKSDEHAAQRARDFHLGWFLHPIVYEEYPKTMQNIVKDRLPKFTRKEIMAACTEDQQQSNNYKHFCRVCKKGFMCGRALGGHMRAHGIGDEMGNIDDEDPGSDWEDKIGGSDRNSNKRMYALRTNPNRLKSCRVCENCGKEFLSWKSFLEHGKCSSEDAESLVSSPSSENEDDDDGGQRGCGWSKRKRSFRANVGSFSSTYPSSEDEDIVLAKCLMALSNARVDPVDMEQEESCESASKDEDRRNAVTAFFAPLTKPNFSSFDKAKAVAKGMFECKACKKVFTSHQALGGHRASHKKVKGCFAARENQFDDSLANEDVITHEDFFSLKTPSSLQYDHSPSVPLVGASRRKSRVHECSICHRVFSTGQALGGHKRCHWLTSNTPDPTSLVKYHQHQDHNNYERPPLIQHKPDPLDLNLPPTPNDIAGIRRDPHNPLSFEVSTEINLHSWVDVDAENKSHIHNNQQHKYQTDDENDKINSIKNTSTNVVALANVDDEADSKVKFAKLSELNDMNITGTSSPWLQVGIGSTTDGGANP